MRLLALGGTWYVGHAIVTAAIDPGWSVTTFNLGASGTDVPGVLPIRGDRTRPADVAELASLGQREFDLSRAVEERCARPARMRVSLSA